jgi:hypothetical protein
MKFSLINVNNQAGNRVDGNWIQNHIGTMETAFEVAKQTEAANGGQITVAIVTEVNSSVPMLTYWTDLIRLN